MPEKDVKMKATKLNKYIYIFKMQYIAIYYIYIYSILPFNSYVTRINCKI